jgi:hypothetical protein
MAPAAAAPGVDKMIMLDEAVVVQDYTVKKMTAEETVVVDLHIRYKE